MVSTPRRKSAPASTGPAKPSAGADLHPPAHNIWLAGLGALASAQAEGGKVFEGLVKQGLALQSQTQALARERMAEAAERMEAMTSQAGGGAWDRLGGIFEQRVARAMTSMGMPSAQQLADLTARVEALERALAAQAPAPRKTASRRPPR